MVVNISYFNALGAETGIIFVSAMSADVLVKQGARAVMILTMQDQWLLVFHEQGFKLPASSQKMKEDTIIFKCTKKNQYDNMDKG